MISRVGLGGQVRERERERSFWRARAKHESARDERCAASGGGDHGRWSISSRQVRRASKHRSSSIGSGYLTRWARVLGRRAVRAERERGRLGALWRTSPSLSLSRPRPRSVAKLGGGTHRRCSEGAVRMNRVVMSSMTSLGGVAMASRTTPEGRKERKREREQRSKEGRAWRWLLLLFV